MLSVQPDGSVELNWRRPIRQAPRPWIRSREPQPGSPLALVRSIARRHLDTQAVHALFHQHLTTQSAARAQLGTNILEHVELVFFGDGQLIGPGPGNPHMAGSTGECTAALTRDSRDVGIDRNPHEVGAGPRTHGNLGLIGKDEDEGGHEASVTAV